MTQSRTQGGDELDTVLAAKGYKRRGEESTRFLSSLSTHSSSKPSQPVYKPLSRLIMQHSRLASIAFALFAFGLFVFASPVAKSSGTTDLVARGGGEDTILALLLALKVKVDAFIAALGMLTTPCASTR